MSINVTVHGNPISIKKGKMVTYDVDTEFDRRRQIRLQQVRQQSKQIAADVRNRVRKEKAKQLSHIEKQGEKDLKHWQARKLHNLQKHYQECMNEVGSAHTNAALERNVDQVLADKASKNQNSAEKRAKIATERQREEDRQRNLDSTKATARKRFIRNVEDTRSAMVAKLKKGNVVGPNKRKKLKTVSTDVTITNNVATDTELTSSEIENISTNSHLSAESMTKSLTEYEISEESSSAEDPSKYAKEKHKNLPRKPVICTSNGSVSVEDEHEHIHNMSLDLNDIADGKSVINLKNNNLNAIDAAEKELDKYNLFINHSQPYYLNNTKISDRICQRSVSAKTKAAERNNTNNEDVRISCRCKKHCLINNKDGQQKRESILPFVPTVTLRRDSTIYDEKDEQVHTVKYYDHFNHFNKESNVPPLIHKISKDSVRIDSPTDQQETQLFHKLMKKRDKAAHERGIKAIEKVRIQKDYKKLMEELPVLQKQERLASMRTHNPTYHMSNERLQNLERERQNRIENIFEDYYHKAKYLESPVITIKPVRKTPPGEEAKMPFKILDLTETPPQLNLAEWNALDISASNQNETERLTVMNENAILQNKQKELASLLDRVNKQRELLLKEVSNLPASSNLQKILEDEELLKLIGPHSPEQAEKPILVSPASSPPIMKKANTRTFTGSNTKSRLQKKQIMQKTRNKNEQTQTSPPQGPRTRPNKQKSSDTIDSKEINTSEATKSKQNEESKGNVCEIIIKMNDESNVKICATSLAQSIKRNTKKNKVYEAQRENEKLILVKTKYAEKESQTHKVPMSYDVSTSTTYMSPPEVTPVVPVRSRLSNKEKNALKNVLHRKPQQSNINITDDKTSPHHTSLASEHSNKKELNPRLIKYIKKLLSMSRQSIDELTVSSVSDVSTPGSSILDTSTNTSLIQLQNVMNHFNLNLADLQKYIILPDANNSLNEITEERESKFSAYGPEQSVDTSQVIHTDTSVENANKLLESVQTYEPQQLQESELNIKDAPNGKYSSVINKYSELTQSCCDKIATLANLIDKVRKEKQHLLYSPSSDKNDNSDTSYLNLPSKFINNISNIDSNENTNIIDQDKSSSSSLNSLDRLLLTVDDHLEKYSLKQPLRDNCDKKYLEKATIDDIKVIHSENSFVPMLIGIPKCNEHDEILNNEDIDSIKSRLHELLQDTKPKPPPTLLSNAARHNINIDMTPHELSTIIEIDTVGSSRNVSDAALQKSHSPEHMLPSKDNSPVHKKPDGKDKQLKNVQKSILKKTSDNVNLIEEEHNKSDISGIQLISSDKSTSSTEDIARILQNLGLNWAVPTLKKTQESLAISSSSSSGDTSIKKYVSFKDTSSSASSEIYSKGPASKQLKKVYGNILLENSTNISIYSRESQNISRTPIGTESQSKDRSQQRTSTPLLISSNSNSGDKTKDNLFTAESDLSSVQICDDMYLSIPQATLDTNISLNKSD